MDIAEAKPEYNTPAWTASVGVDKKVKKPAKFCDFIPQIASDSMAESQQCLFPNI